MPFTSKAQVKKCFALKSRGAGKGWNCHEWADKTKSIKKLPEHVKKSSDNQPDAQAKKAAVVAELEKQATTLPQLLGIRAAALSMGVAK